MPYSRAVPAAVDGVGARQTAEPRVLGRRWRGVMRVRRARRRTTAQTTSRAHEGEERRRRARWRPRRHRRVERHLALRRAAFAATRKRPVHREPHRRRGIDERAHLAAALRATRVSCERLTYARLRPSEVRRRSSGTGPMASRRLVTRGRTPGLVTHRPHRHAGSATRAPRLIGMTPSRQPRLPDVGLAAVRP